MLRPLLRRPQNARGFTLVELMITVTVIAVLAAVALPNIAELVAKQRVRSTSGDLFNSLMRARSAAIKLRADVALTPVDGRNWELGWSVPAPTTATAQIDARGAISQVAVSGPASVVYRSNGRPVTPATAKFEVSASDTDEIRCVMLDLTGLPYQKKTGC